MVSETRVLEVPDFGTPGILESRNREPMDAVVPGLLDFSISGFLDSRIHLVPDSWTPTTLESKITSTCVCAVGHTVLWLIL